jgi:hypothetical protein
MATDGRWRDHPEVAARLPAEASSRRVSVMRWFPVEARGMPSASVGGRGSRSRRDLQGPAPSTHRSERRARAVEVRVVGLSRGPSWPWLCCLQFSWPPRCSSSARPEGSGWESTPPGLRLLRGLGRHLPHPAVPRGVPSVRVHARPLSVRRRQGGRAIPAAQHPKMPCSRRSSRKAGASVQLPRERVRARRVVRLAVFRALRPCRLPKQAVGPVVPGIVDSSRATRPSRSGPSEGGRLPRPGSSGACRKRPATVSLAGLLSWWSQRLPLHRHTLVRPLPARCRPRPNEVPTGVSTRPTEVVRDGFFTDCSAACLRPEAASLESCSALAVSHDFGGLLRTCACRSVAPCCRPWGSPGCRPPTRVVPRRQPKLLSRTVPRPGRLGLPTRGRPCCRGPCRRLRRRSLRRQASMPPTLQSVQTPRDPHFLRRERHASTQPTPLLRTHPKVARCSPRPDDCSPGRASRCRHPDCDDRGRPSPCPVVVPSTCR